MRLLFLGLVLIFTVNFSFGQEKIRKNELGLSFLKISTLPFDKMPSKSYELNFGIHGIYKRRLNKFLFARADQSFYKYEIKKSSEYGNHVDNIRETNSSVGIEFRYLRTKSNKLNLFAGMDLTRFSYFSKYSFHSTWDRYASETIRTGFGINPFVGINLYPVKRLVISLEASFLKGTYRDKIIVTEWKGFVRPTVEDKGKQPFSQTFLLRTASIGWSF